MSIRKLRAGRVPTVTAEQYIGERGTIFWNEATGSLRLSDGHTLGGISISIDAISVVADNLLPDVDNIRGIGAPDRRWNHIHLGDGGVYFDGAYSTPQTVPFLPDALPHPLLPATDDITDLGSPTKRFRNVYLGPASLYMADTVTNANIEIKVTNGTLYLDGAQNLAVGDLTIVGNTIQSILPTTNINIGNPADSGLFTVGRQTVITTPNLGAFTAALLINGATTLPVDPSPLTFNGTLVHGVAQTGQNARFVFDTFGSGLYNSFVGRYARGTIASPTPVQQNDIMLRISANGYGTSGFSTGGSARIDFVADENFTDTAKGTQIDFWTTPVGSTAITKNASVNNDGFVGTGIRFTGDNSYQTTAGIPLTAKAVSGATYVATLGVDGKLDATQIPSSLTGAIVFKGVWDATTNTPALSNSTPAGLSTGWEYIVEVGGTRDIGDGSKTFLAGDFVIYDGTHWKQVPSGNAFISLSSGGHITVNQTTGAMTLGSDATPVASTSTIVSRDSSGNFAANLITANLTGNVTGSVSGNAGSVTNGVYTTGTQSIDGVKTFTSTIQGNISGSAGSVANGVVTTGSYSDPSWLTLSKSKVGLGNVDNTADANKNVLYATTAGGAPATDVYAWAKAATKPTYTATDVGLGNVTNESKATMFTSPTFTGTVAGVTKAMVGLGSVENTALSTWAGSTNITTVGTLGTLTVTATITGSVSGNAGTVTNGVVTTGSYSDPSWLTISKSKVGLGNVENTALSTSTYYIGTTQNTYSRASAAQTLTGVSISGNAGTVTNGVYTTDTGTVTNTMLAGSIANNKLSNSTISGVALGSTLNALTAGFGLVLESGTTYDGSAAHTISALHGVTGPVTVSGNAYALDLGAANGLIILNNVSQANYTITISNPVAGKVVRVMCLNMKTGGGATTVTVSGLTAANSSNGNASFQGNSNGAVAIVEFLCTTTATSGVYMNTGGAK
jgi:hypothetical protein